MRVNVLKTALVALLLHGVFTVAVPYSILRLTARFDWLHFDLGTQIAGWVLVALGALLYIVAGYELLLLSETTATPLDEPIRLRIGGLYRWSRNPMLLGVVVVLIGESLAFQSFALLAYALLYWIWLTVFLVLIEEPAMRRRFGDDFDRYRRRVPRWFLRFGPRRPAE